ncbi:acyl-CoA thioesterase [Undibacterium rivi]|nr:thioesterase family protein [Undibacterium rivi]
MGNWLDMAIPVLDKACMFAAYNSKISRRSLILRVHTDAVNYSASPSKTENMMIWDYPQPFTLKLTPTSSDIDGLQHTNNAVYVQWCEVIGWAHSEQLGLSLNNYQALNRAMAIRHAAYDYLLPSVMGDELILGTWIVASDGKLNMERRFQLIREADEAVIMRGQWNLVCIEISTGKAKRMPAEFCDIYLPAIAK